MAEQLTRREKNTRPPMSSLGIASVVSATRNSASAPTWKKELVAAIDHLWESVREAGRQRRRHLSELATFVLADAIRWLAGLPDNSIHAVVTDPPYSLAEYAPKNHSKMLSGRGGVWRFPPSFDGHSRRPLPRFTVLSTREAKELNEFFVRFATAAARVLVPGGHIILASNPLLSTITFGGFQAAGLEKRGELIRLVQTLRGGDRPKGSEEEFPNVTVMPRSCWEPWGIFRKPFDGTVAENLRKWGAGGLRRVSDEEPFRDVIRCSPARGLERKIAPHPSLKPQRFLRRIVRAALPLGVGIVYDPFAGSGSTLAAAEALGYRSIGTEREPSYFQMGISAFDGLASLEVKDAEAKRALQQDLIAGSLPNRKQAGEKSA